MQRALVERARDGDLDAFTTLVQEAHPRLRGIAGLVLRDSSRAEDAVQEALLSAWRGLRALREPDAWDAWLHRLTMRACYRVANKERRRALVELRATTDQVGPAVSDSSATVAERDRIGRALARLDIDQRAVVVLHYYVDLPVREVAEILGIPAGTANSRLHRALETMRRTVRRDPDVADDPALEPSS